MKDKVQLVHDLDSTVADPEGAKRDHAQQLYYFVVKER